nr:ATP-grasp domain-containing protein [Novosphingobium marinum]
MPVSLKPRDIYFEKRPGALPQLRRHPVLRNLSPSLLEEKGICLFAGANRPLLLQLIAALPSEETQGFILAGPQSLASLSKFPGCRGHLVVDLASASNVDAHRLARIAGDRPVVAIGADDIGCDYLDELAVRAPINWIGADCRESRALLRDKAAFTRLARNLDLPTPETMFFAGKSGIDTDETFARLGAPIVIKPTNMAGGHGVVFVENERQFADRVLGNANYRFSPLVAQAFVPGVDIGLGVLSDRGRMLHYSIQVRRNGRFEFAHHEQFLSATRAIIERTRFSGFAQFDARLSEDGRISLLECNPRTWSSLGQSTWCGLNFVSAVVAAARLRASSQPTSLCSGIAPYTGVWWSENRFRPAEIVRLNPEQRRLALCVLLNFAVNGWRDRLRRWRRKDAIMVGLG